MFGAWVIIYITVPIPFFHFCICQFRFYRAYVYWFDSLKPLCFLFYTSEYFTCQKNPSIAFRPSVEVEDPEGFYAFFESLLLDMMKMGTFIPRVDTEQHEEQENYSVYCVELMFNN